MSLYLVDGHALAYRSYYAFVRRPLVNSKGEETSAVYGFTNTILSLIQKHKPTHLAVVFDSAEITFRKELFADYKANRKAMPDSLVKQLPQIFEVLGAMSIPIVSMDGYEADDIIATVAKKLEGDMPVRIVSGDKDLFQVLSDRTHVIRPGKGGLLEDEIDPDLLKQDFGLSAEEFIDYQALRGDPTDNVPGVPGVGEKTALKLIQQFGSLENVYDNIDSVSSKSVQGKLTKGRESAFLSRKLVRLDTSVPIDLTVEELTRREFDKPALTEMFKNFEFSNLMSAIDVEPPQVRPAKSGTYTLVDEEDQLTKLAAALGECTEIAVDVEASGLDPMSAELAGIAISTEEGKGWYVPVSSRIDGEEVLLLTPPREAPGFPIEVVIKHLGPVFGNPEIKKIGQNFKYDAIQLTNAGMPLDGIHFDTMLASYCLDPSRRSHGLDNLVAELFQHKMIPFKSLFDKRTKKKDIRLVPLKTTTEYACEDVDYTLRLKNVFAPLLAVSQVRALFEDVEMPLSIVLTQMEKDGIALDLALLKKLSKELSGKLSKLETSIYEEAGERFNINSTAHLQNILFTRLGLSPAHKTKTGFSTDVDVLKSLASQHKVPELVLEYRTLAKLKSTYIDALPDLVNSKTGRVHTSYNQAVTSTGRLSSSDPNLQNIPIRTAIGREIRKAFVSRRPDWTLLDADYSQIELRIMAHLSKDAELIKAFVDDDDVHRRTAARILGVRQEDVSDQDRSRAKTVNFGIMYGMGPRGLAQSLNIDVKEARKFIDDYFESYPGVRRFIDETIARARQEKSVSTMLGRARQLPDIDSTDRRSQAFSERTAVNTPIQGTAADIIKIAMVDIQRRLSDGGFKAIMILQVHDELLFDLPREELDEVRGIVRSSMEAAMVLDVPLRVDMGTGANWLEAHQ